MWLIYNPIPNSNVACNKDLNGGYGTYDKFGDGFLSRLPAYAKKRFVKLPVLALANIAGIFKSTDNPYVYTESLSDAKKAIYDYNIKACVVYGALATSSYENNVIHEIKKAFPGLYVIVVGSFPTKFPDLYPTADSVVIGEPESLFMAAKGRLSELIKLGKRPVSTQIENLDVLPLLCFDGMSPEAFSYFPMLRGRTAFIEATRGCPYSCGYYCPYGENQGKRIRSYSPARVVNIMEQLTQKYSFSSFQFRDPVFGLSTQYIDELCGYLIDSRYSFCWGMETRIDLLNEKNLLLMKRAGLRAINVGVETSDEHVAKLSKRKLAPSNHQEYIIDFAAKNNIRINAFYILGLENDTEDSCKETIEYSLRLNTHMAKYNIATPYPGTRFYEDLDKSGMITSRNLSDYNAHKLVFQHPNLSSTWLYKVRDRAYKRYFYRLSTLLKILRSLVS